MKKFNLLLLLLFVFAGCKSEQTNTRTIASASELCGRYRWDDSKLPLKISVDRQFNDQFKASSGSSSTTIEAALSKSFQAWETAIDRGAGTIFSPDIQLLESSPDHNTISLYRGDVDENKNEVLGVYAAQNWFNDQSSQALAVTYYTVNISNGFYNLTSADIIFNTRDHYFGFFNTDYSPVDNYATVTRNGIKYQVRQYDFRTVLVHELGHFIGYCHVDEKAYKSVMQPFYSGANRSLTDRDKSYIKGLYAPGNTTNLKTKSKTKHDPKDDEEIHFVVELLATGECNHYKEGEKFYSHQVDLDKKHH